MRPFGVSLLLAGRDDNGPQLYQIDPSGSYFAWKASAIGKNMTNAKTFLEKRWVLSSHPGLSKAIMHASCLHRSAPLLVGLAVPAAGQGKSAFLLGGICSLQGGTLQAANTVACHVMHQVQ